MEIIFDLDGTLINCEERLYRLFQNLVPESNLSKKEYWDLKRNKKNHEYILTNIFGKDAEFIENFNNSWLIYIEKKQYLDLDQLFDYTISGLNDLLKNNILYLVTSRQSRSMLMYELECLNLKGYFKEIYVTEHKTDKYSLINSNIQIKDDTILVGDTGYDVNTGKRLGIKTMAVSSGFLSKDVLLKYNPDYVCNNFVNGFRDFFC